MNATRERLPHLTDAGRETLANCGQRRVSYRQVLRACQATDMRLRDGYFLGDKDNGQVGSCGCPLAILYVQRRGYPITNQNYDQPIPRWLPDVDAVDDWILETFGLPYGNGFMAGFDYTACPTAGEFKPGHGALYVAGYRDGRAVCLWAQRHGLFAA